MTGLNDHERLASLMAVPALVRLHRKLSRLKSVLTFVNSGAHPDDENNAMLAALRFGLGMRTIVLCSTRGEGGQNALGPERIAALAALRTREMEVSASRIDADVTWVGHGPDDEVHDFGFSKDGDDTLRRWGPERIAERLVRAYRTDRPDIVTPTFLDVPGQHGHHRAMTRAAFAAVALAADPAAFPEHLAEGLKPWQVAKFYLPAWSGAGASYDDEVPPPPATLVLDITDPDEASGATWDQLGQWSRAAHASQGMGFWHDARHVVWPLHLKWTAAGSPGPETDIRAGLPANVGALATTTGLPASVADALLAAQAGIDAAFAAFPDRIAVRRAAASALGSIERAAEALPAEFDAALGHRLSRKRRELHAVVLETAAVSARATAAGRLVPGGATTIEVAASSPDVAAVKAEVVARTDLSASGTAGDVDGLSAFELTAPAGAPFTSSYPPRWDALGGNGDASIRLSAIIENRLVSADLDLDVALAVVPAVSVRLEPDAVLTRPGAPAPIDVTATTPAEVAVALSLPSGWRAETLATNRFRVHPPASLAQGVYAITPQHGGAGTAQVDEIAYAHVGRLPFIRSTPLRVLAADVALPQNTRIGYVGGGNDSVGVWLKRLGLDVTDLAEGRLADADLSQFTTLVVGIFAFGTRPDLASATDKLRRFVEDGGHLVTLYHRPSDGWNPATVPPRFLEIGLPSLRWRVTNPDAPVTLLAPDHPLIAGPNRIGPADWTGWDKERGLYFVSRWDDAYVPLLSMSDAGEAPLKGALVSARIGSGRHTHTSLVLHHQLDKLVPGAFRLVANLVQPA